MRCIKLFKLFFIACCCLGISFSNSLLAINKVPRQYNFKEYNLFDGLPQGQVTSIAQDHYGYLWLGSYAGLIRYNGSEFISVDVKLPSNTIRSISSLHEGKLLATTAAGMCLIHPTKNISNTVIDCALFNERLPNKNLFKLNTKLNGGYLVGSEGGLLQIDSEKTTVYDQTSGLPSTSSRVAIEDSNHVIWVGTDSGLAKSSQTDFVEVLYQSRSIGAVRTLLDTAEGIWVGANNGLYLINKETNAIEKKDGNLFKGNGVNSLLKDSLNNLWIGTYKGVYRLTNGAFERLSPQKGLKSVTTYSIYEDKEGIIWFGSDAGLIKYLPGEFTSYSEAQGLSNDFVRAISLDKRGNIWLGTRKGVSVLNPKTEEITRLVEQLQQDQLRVYAIKNLPDDSVFIGTQTGLIHWKDNQVIGKYTTQSGLPSNYVSAFQISQNNEVWIGTARGLAKWSQGKIQPVPENPIGLSNIFSISEDNLGRLWLGTHNYGVIIYNPKTQSYSQIEGVPETHEYTVWSMDKDADGNLWIGSNGNGLLHVSQDLKLLAKYDRYNGLGNNYVWQVKVDSKGRVWAYTNNGLKRIEKYQVTTFDGTDGLPDLEGAATAVAEHPNGDLWFGTAFGVTRYAENRKTQPEPPPVLIEKLTFGDKVVVPNETLTYENAILSATFVSLSYRNHKDLKFSYRLIGASREWSPLQSESKIQFAKLAPGNYELQVKATHNGHQFSETPAKLKFSLSAPYWQSWWFTLLIILVVVILVTQIINFRLRKISLEKERLENEVNSRTQELRQKNKELKQLVRTDHLTKLNNRRYLLECLSNEIARISRSSSPVSLAFIIIDVDHFKNINDTFGHEAGDRALINIANEIKKHCRSTDIPARYGGEEFALMLPYTDSSGAMHFAQGLCNKIAAKKIEINQENSVAITVSAGVSCLSSLEDLTAGRADKIIREADVALYRAKNTGRNTCCEFDPKQDIVEFKGPT
ncbi:diguanylate cyclase [Aliikangiella sp. IMCC44632]